jgi:hypothetical protein
MSFSTARSPTSGGDHHELFAVYGRTDTDKTLADAVLIKRY